MSERKQNQVLADSLAKCRNSFLALCVFSLGINLLTLVVPLYLLQIVDRVIPNRSTETLFVLTGIFVVGLVTLAALETIRQFVLLRIGRFLENRLAGETLGGSIVRSVRKQRRPSSQGLRDLGTLRNFLTGPSILPILDAPFVPIVIAVIFMLHPVVGWITLGGALLLLAVAVVNELSTRSLGEAAGEASIRAAEDAHAITRNAEAIEAMGMRQAVLGLWSRRNARALELQEREAARNSQLTALARFLRMSLQIVVLCVAALLVIDNQMTMGAMIAAVLLMRRAVAPVERAIGTWKSVISARSAYKRVKRRIGSAESAEYNTPLNQPLGHLKVSSLSYYPPQSGAPAIFRKINFELQPGETLGLIGPSGAGKTTLARLLLGNLKPSSGYVRLDGFDVCDWDPADLGPFVGYLPQDVELFAGTVRQNIARMTDGDPHSVIEAAELAGLHDMISRLPNGYETEIGEGGVTLSGGQRQRVALARAVYGNPRFLVLDEPDANLDREGQDALLRVILILKQRGTTIVLITHRPAMLNHADKVLMLHRGSAQVSSTAEDSSERHPPLRLEHAAEESGDANA